MPQVPLHHVPGGGVKQDQVGRLQVLTADLPQPGRLAFQVKSSSGIVAFVALPHTVVRAPAKCSPAQEQPRPPAPGPAERNRCDVLHHAGNFTRANDLGTLKP